jgi:hypothetical protein
VRSKGLCLRVCPILGSGVTVYAGMEPPIIIETSPTGSTCLLTRTRSYTAAPSGTSTTRAVLPSL